MLYFPGAQQLIAMDCRRTLPNRSWSHVKKGGGVRFASADAAGLLRAQHVQERNFYVVSMDGRQISTASLRHLARSVGCSGATPSSIRPALKESVQLRGVGLGAACEVLGHSPPVDLSLRKFD